MTDEKSYPPAICLTSSSFFRISSAVETPLAFASSAALPTNRSSMFRKAPPSGEVLVAAFCASSAYRARA